MPLQPVMRLIHERLRQGSRPGARRDRAHLALAVEGGGMRGVVSAGMLAALEQLGALRAFDSLWGASAGAINGAYFLTGQAAWASPIYADRLTGSTFINPRRFLRGGEFISLDYLFSLLRHPGPYALDSTRLLRSPIRLHPTSFSLGARRAVDLGHPEDEEELFLRLRASAQVPLFAGQPIAVNGQLYLDAACGEFIPVKTAFEGGATHVLALHTRPPGEVPPPLTKVERQLYQRRMEDLALFRRLENRARHYDEEMRAIAAYEARALSLHPRPGRVELSATERRREPVLEGYLRGLEAVLLAWPTADELRELATPSLGARARAVRSRLGAASALARERAGQLGGQLGERWEGYGRAPSFEGFALGERAMDVHDAFEAAYHRLVQGARTSPEQT